MPQPLLLCRLCLLSSRQSPPPTTPRDTASSSHQTTSRCIAGFIFNRLHPQGLSFSSVLGASVPADCASASLASSCFVPAVEIDSSSGGVELISAVRAICNFRTYRLGTY